MDGVKANFRGGIGYKGFKPPVSQGDQENS